MDDLDSAVKYRVQIVSSCDFLGKKKHNLVLSARRAEAVKDLLLMKNNIVLTEISFKGIGELESLGLDKNKHGIKKHRKTSIIFEKTSDFVNSSIFDQIAGSKKGETFILENIVFDPGRHLLKKKSIPIIKDLLKVLQDNPKLEIEINGHVCCGKNPKDTIDGYDKDTKTFNLSQTRAQHIYKYLVLKKIDSNRLVHKGYGFTRPLTFPEVTSNDKLNNRRVEIKVLKN